MAGDAGVSLVEILVAAFVIGVSVIALSLMFANGSAWVSAMGEDRVAAGLAQQRIEQVRAAGWTAPMAAVGVTTESSHPVGCTDLNDPQCARTVKYTRVTTVEYVDPCTADGLNTPLAPPYTMPCMPGTESDTKRITVTVTPVFVPGDSGEQAVPRALVVTLQGWITKAGR